MTSYIIRRLIFSLVLLLVVTTLSFGAVELAPSNVLASYIGIDEIHNLSSEELAKAEAALGLDKPWFIRYLRWLGSTLRGNLGRSMLTHEPVSKLIGRRIKNTFVLMGLALVTSIIAGNGIGILTGLRQNSIADRVLTIASFVTVSVPSFFIGLLLIYIFGVKLELLPTGGIRSLGRNDILRHLILPTFVLSLRDIAQYTRYSRTSILETINANFVTVARAKGLGQREVVLKHVLKNSLIPILSVIGTRIPRIFGGTLIIETVFSWPGLGFLTYNAIRSRDYPVILGGVLVLATAVVLINLVVDILYVFVDPRIRYE